MNKHYTSTVLGREISDLIDPDHRRTDYPGWPDVEEVQRIRTVAARERGAVGRAVAKTFTTGIRTGVAGLIGRIRRARENRIAAAALSRLNPRSLRDIGVHADDIARLRSGQVSVAAFNAERAARSFRGRHGGRVDNVITCPPVPTAARPAANQPRFANAA